jgi:hypothetical protein
MVGAAAQSLDIGSVIKVAPSRCLSLYPDVITIKDGIYENGITVRSIANATVDFRGVTVWGQANNSSVKTMTIVRSFNNVCVLGGRHWGKQDPQVVDWATGHSIYGAGMLFKDGSGNIVVENATIENSLQDGITLGGGLAMDVGLTLWGVWIRNSSDDAIQNDPGRKLALIEDSLIEGKTAVSMRPGGDSGQADGSHGVGVVPIRNSLVEVICVRDDRLDGSCGPGRSANVLFKSSAASSEIRWDMQDSIVKFEARAGSWKAMRLPPGTYRNVTVVWDPEEPGLRWQGPALPPGATLTTDRSVWANAKAEWLRVHGCSATGGCTFPGS